MTKSKKESKTPLDPAKVVFLAETICHVACENTIYDNPPVETSRLDCIQAARQIPCDLCCTRYHIPEDPRLFPPSSDETILPPFLIPPASIKPPKSKKKADDLKKKEFEEVFQALIEYEERLYAEERLVAPHRYRPRSLYFPKALQELIASNLLKIKSRAELNVILASNEWPYIESQSSNLFGLISTLQNQVLTQRPKPKSKKVRKSIENSSDSLSDVDMVSSDVDVVPAVSPSTLHSVPFKRVALAPAGNQPPSKRKVQARRPQQSFTEARESYSRPIGKSYRSTLSENTQPGRRSTRLQTKCKCLSFNTILYN